MTRLPPATRAMLATWRARPLVRRVHAASGTLASVGLAVAGLLGALAGGWLADTGMVWLGVVVIAESVLLLVVGLNREDGTGRPRRGARTVGQVLDDEALRP